MLRGAGAGQSIMTTRTTTIEDSHRVHHSSDFGVGEREEERSKKTKSLYTVRLGTARTDRFWIPSIYLSIYTVLCRLLIVGGSIRICVPRPVAESRA